MAFHAVILDAGSTGTRAYVYRVTPGGDVEEKFLLKKNKKGEDEIDKIESKTGITQLVEDAKLDKNAKLDKGAKPDKGANTHLGVVFNKVTELFEKVDEEEANRLPRKLYLLATAGVRDNLTPGEQKTLDELLRKYLDSAPVVQDLGFVDKKYTLKVIPGTDEAKYGWIAANYLKKADHDFKAGYVEMGGASAQIAFPVPPELEDVAKEVVKLMNLETVVEMVERSTGSDSIRKLRKSRIDHGETTWENFISTDAELKTRAELEGKDGEETELKARARAELEKRTEVRRRGEPRKWVETVQKLLALARKGGWSESQEEELQAVLDNKEEILEKLRAELWTEEEADLLKDWDGDVATLEKVSDGLADKWECNAEQLKKVVREMGNKAVLEDIRQRKMFFASYPLGVNAGYREYVECVVTAQQEIKEKLGITGTDVLLYDPSKRAGYPGLAEGAGEHITRTGAHITLNGVPNHASNKALTLSLVNQAQTTLFSEENVYASLVLRPVVQNLSFIGGANFWWHMGPDQDKKKVTDEEEEEEEGGDFRLSALFKRWKKRRGLTHQQFHAKYEIPKSLIKNKDNEIFLARWVLQALSAAFGFDPRGKEELKVTFTPYNGPDGNRFSWTLGTAVLLSWDDKHLPQD